MHCLHICCKCNLIYGVSGFTPPPERPSTTIIKNEHKSATLTALSNCTTEAELDRDNADLLNSCIAIQPNIVDLWKDQFINVHDNHQANRTHKLTIFTEMVPTNLTDTIVSNGRSEFTLI